MTNTPCFDTATEEEIRYLWEETSDSAQTIGLRYGVTKNVIIGMAKRRGWNSFNVSETVKNYPNTKTIFERLQILHDQLDKVLLETSTVNIKYYNHK